MVKRGSEKSELELIERIRERARLPRTGGVVLGIGDDCAIFRARGAAEDLLFTTDMLIEDAHFRCAPEGRLQPAQILSSANPASRETARVSRSTGGPRQASRSAPEDLGWKALARGLSDIAAMGGAPRFCLLSLALPAWADRRWIDGFYRGLLKIAEREGAPLIGGDLGRSAKAMCDIVVCGAVPRGCALRRDGARKGDSIYVSGALGGSALGLAAGRGRAWRRHLRPEPRLALGRFLRERGARAAMDLSDGISLDLRRMCVASGLAADIEQPPIYPGATLEQALHGGEDYELLFTASARTRVPPSFGGLPLTRIGAMRAGAPGEVRLNGDLLPPSGWDHLAR